MEKGAKEAVPDEGAGDKLVDDKNGIEVKYVTPTSQNGDAKIDMENLKSAFAGMGKEELMKFANDPFWVRTRWLLFALFWLLWAAMLAGAVAIIVLAPKCSPPAPRLWWQKSPLHRVAPSQAQLTVLTSKLDYYKGLGVQSIVLPNILKVADQTTNDGEDEFTSIAPSYGTLDDFKQLISSAKEKGLKLLLTMIPNHSSTKNKHFTNPNDTSFHVWAGTYPNQEPNNWKSVSAEDRPAWTWDEARKQFYLHQFDQDQPDFNFANPAVLSYFDEIFSFWLEVGVSGFYLERVPFLVEDAGLRNESVARAGVARGVHTGYPFYDHSRTRDLQPQLDTLLARWKRLADDRQAILVVDGGSMDANRSAAHLSVHEATFESAPEFPVAQLHSVITSTLAQDEWPVWKMECGEGSGGGWQAALGLVTMLMPGVPLTTDPVPTGEGEAVWKALVAERESPAAQHGRFNVTILGNSSVIAYTRIKKGTPGLAVVFNSGAEETTVSLSLPTVPSELTKVLRSDPPQVFTDKKDNIKREEVQLKGMSVAVYRFVPQADEN